VYQEDTGKKDQGWALLDEGSAPPMPALMYNSVRPNYGDGPNTPPMEIPVCWLKMPPYGGRFSGGRE
jgi:hypothetical protein